jgi:hypothetical protein
MHEILKRHRDTAEIENSRVGPKGRGGGDGGGGGGTGYDYYRRYL